MGTLATIGRRGFLIGSAAVAGGVVFGVYKLKSPAPNPLTLDVSLNAFVVINSEGITLVAPKAEMGQGVHTSWAALIAEELDVTLDQITVIHGPPAKAYYNSALFGLSLPFADYEVTDRQEALRRFVGDGAKLIGLQLTGGSTSMRDGFIRMRTAGASAREMLKSAAAKEWGLSASELKTEAGKVIAPDGSELTYEELATRAAEGPAPTRVVLRDPSEWKILGKTQNRVDMPAKVTGEAVFGSDVMLGGMVFATLLQSPTRNGIASYDATKARGMTGVLDVLDLGDVLAVVATNTWYAMQAAKAIEAEWNAAKYPATLEGIYAQLEQGFEAEPNSTERDDGNADSEHPEEMARDYRLPPLAHTCMEVMNATAYLRDGRLQIWCGNQAPISVQEACAEVAGLSPEQVEVNTLFMGGGFGRRSETDFATLATRVAMQIPRIPVKVTWSREEDIRNDMYRPPSVARYRGAVEGGKVVLLDGQISGASVFAEAGARSSGERTIRKDAEFVSGAADQPYGIQDYRVRGYISPSELPVGYWRSVSTSFNAFYLESFMDELAVEAGMDPIELRLKTLRAGGHAPSVGVLETVRDMSGWGTALPEGRARGVAFSYTFGTPTAEVVEIEQRETGLVVSKMWIAADVGTAIDPGNIEAQLTGGAVYGLSAAILGEITLKDGQVAQSNFHDYDALRMFNTPAFEVEILQTAPHIGGIGECGTPPAAPALTNALFALTGKRARTLPLMRAFTFQR